MEGSRNADRSAWKVIALALPGLMSCRDRISLSASSTMANRPKSSYLTSFYSMLFDDSTSVQPRGCWCMFAVIRVRSAQA
jgi:hypothetical protein